jgi:hypothetical protein
MTKTLQVSRLRTGTIYKLVLLGLLVGSVPVFLVSGLLASADLITLNWNDQPVTGPKAIFIGPLMGLFFALVLTAIAGSVMALGLWIFGRFRPLALDFYPVAEVEGRE